MLKDTIVKGLRYLKRYGLRKMLIKIKEKMRRVSNAPIRYKEWLKNHLPIPKELEQQKKKQFEKMPLISILVPTYNTPDFFLKEMIESVNAQTYPKWELCIADASTERERVKSIIEVYAKQDHRIKIRYLKANLGISENTNAALELAKGEYIGLLDHDDLLEANALYEVVACINRNKAGTVDFIYTDEDKVDEKTKNYFEPHFKQDWAPDTLRSYNYICHFVVFKKSLLDKVGKFRKGFDGAQDYDMVLRLTEKAECICHIPKVLYHWRTHQDSTAKKSEAKEYTVEAGKKALQEHLNRIGEAATVTRGLREGVYCVAYELKQIPKVSIIIPNKDHKQDLEKCINAIFQKTSYTHYEIIIIENNSETEEIFAYYKELEQNEKIRIVKWEGSFNYSKINNYGISFASGDYIILLNNDVQIITPGWIEEMLMHCQREEVGIVGSKLYYPDDTIQHAGVIVGLGGVAGHSHKYFNREDDGYFSRLKIVQNLSAVTAACMMVKKEVYEAVGGFNEEFQVAFNDVDFCLKVREEGKLVVFTPYVEGYHYESKSRGLEDTQEKIQRFQREITLFVQNWGRERRDPYYSDNLTLDTENFAIRNNK